MDVFSQYKPATLNELKQGTCIILPKLPKNEVSEATLVAIKIKRVENDDNLADREDLIAFWSSESSHYAPELIRAASAASVIQIPDARVHLSDNPAHIHFGQYIPNGAIFLHNDEPHVVIFNEAERQNQRFTSVRIRDGERGPSTLHQSVAWVSVWNVQHKADSYGRSEVICSIDINKLHGNRASRER
jgi:hypothetical protein